MRVSALMGRLQMGCGESLGARPAHRLALYDLSDRVEAGFPGTVMTDRVDPLQRRVARETGIGRVPEVKRVCGDRP